MKRKILTIILTVCLLLSLALFSAACKQNPAPVPPVVTTGPQDYVDGDSQIVTELTVDIADNTEAFYIGSSAISSVKVNGSVIDAKDYIVGSNHLLLASDWNQSMGLGTHEVEVTYNTKSLKFKITVEDNKPLAYELPSDLNFYIPSDSATLPVAEFKSALQEKTVTYSLQGQSGAVEFDQTTDGLVLSDVQEGEYVYNVTVLRKGQTVVNRDYPVKVVSRDYYEGIVDTTDGKMAENMWINTSLDNSTSYVEEYTDAAGISRSAVKFVRGATGDEHTRIVGLNPERLKELIELGYKKLSFWYCVETEHKPEAPYNNGVELYMMYSFGGAEWISVKNVWTRAEIDITKLFTASAIEERSAEVKFAMGFGTRHYNYSTSKNAETIVYFSEIIATDRSGDIAPYVGDYVCGEETLNISAEGKATLNGTEYSAYTSNNYLVLTDENHNNISASIANGVVILDGKVYNGTASLEFTQKSESNLNILDSLKTHGYTAKSFVTEDGAETEASSFVFLKNKTYSLRVEVYKNGEKIGEAVKPITTKPIKVDGNIAPFAATNGIVSSSSSAGVSAVTNDGDALKFICHRNDRNHMVFDSGFVQEAIEQGLTRFTITFSMETTLTTWARCAFGYYDASENAYVKFGDDFLTNYVKIDQTYPETKTWDLSKSMIEMIKFEEGDKLIFGYLEAGDQSSTTCNITHLEFMAPIYTTSGNIVSDKINDYVTYSGTGTTSNESNYSTAFPYGDVYHVWGHVNTENKLTFNSTFVDDCFYKGLTKINLTFLMSNYVNQVDGSLKLYYYDASEDAFVRIGEEEIEYLTTDTAYSTKSFNLTSEQIALIDFAGGDKLVIGGFEAGDNNPLKWVFSGIEFVNPNA